ncbi:hypothetical protein MesoLjLb_69240 [Mesorhizobium sp. L-8-3]|nr:hypothetical protein MesoLjLb_69240 [Mesorhizobium sp. L-8-3]
MLERIESERSGWEAHAFQMNSQGVRPLRVFSLRPEIVGRDEVGKMPTQLVAIVVVEALDGCVLMVRFILSTWQSADACLQAAVGARQMRDVGCNA